MSVSIPSAAKSTPIGDRHDLVANLAEGEKPRDKWRIGTEHEKFGFYTDDLTPPPFDGDRPGIRQLLETLATRFGWDVAREGDTPVALTKGMANITLEPAGQLELSGAPLLSIHETCDEVSDHLKEVRSVADELGIGFIGMGFQPKWRRDQMPWMPKGRYKIMREYMPKVGSLGLDMMTRTCTVQVNLDYGSEADMVKKFRVALALQPIATALFANSPFTEGKPNGFKSFRSHVWTDTDNDRTGMLDFVFEDGFGYERYVDYILDVPMYFSYRDGKYLDLAGQDFKRFMRGELAALPGVKPTMKDWGDHLTTAFPEVRLKQYLEMRGADANTWGLLCALPAFWVGLLYDDVALDAAWDLVKDFSKAERHALRDGVPKEALALRFRNGNVQDLALQALKISEAGLKRRNVLGQRGVDESIYLEQLMEFALSGKTQADTKLDLFHGKWNGSVDPAFHEYAY